MIVPAAIDGQKIYAVQSSLFLPAILEDSKRLDEQPRSAQLERPDYEYDGGILRAVTF